MEQRKRTKDLTEEEILNFKTVELKQWMQRVMTRLHILLEREAYEKLARHYVDVCRGGIDYAKRGLIQLVKVIQEKWQEPNLSVVQ